MTDYINAQGNKTCIDDWLCNTMWGRGATCEVLHVYTHVHVAPTMSFPEHNFTFFAVWPSTMKRKQEDILVCTTSTMEQIIMHKNC